MIGGCSTIRNGNVVGRAFDWTYDESVGFVIRTLRTAGKYATLGISASVPRLTEEFMESGEYNAESFKLIPFYTVDAINEYGLTASILLVPLDKGQTTGTTPLIAKLDEICNLMLVRYIVDNFQTAQEAVEYLRNYVSVYSPQGLADMGYESHFMVSDKTKSYSIEFVNNTLIATDISDKPYMTNFYLNGVTFNEDGTVYTPADVPTHLPSSQGITENGSGLERYNLIVGSYQTTDSIASMRSLMNSLKFTNAYLAETDPQWNTEFVGTWEDFGTFTVDTPASDFTGLKNYIRGVYEQRIRDGKTWQTVHSAVYDLENKTLNLVVQEDGQELEFGFDYYTKEEVDKLISNEIEARQEADQTLQNNIDQLSEDLSQAIEDEAKAREQDDESLAEAIGNEAQARANADIALGDRINAEEQTRGLADTSLGERIDTEITNRQNADGELAQSIRDEETRATTAETNLNTAIAAEESERISADTNLQTQIDSLPTSTDVSSAISAHNTSSTAHSDIRTELGEKQPTLVSGTNIKTINSTTLLGSGNVSVATATQGALADTLNTYMADDISASNQIASRQFVNSSISTNTANFIGTFNSVAEMEAYSGAKTNNDYAFVIGTDTAGNTEYNRYKWTTSETPNKWKYEYTLNNSSFTADQWAAIGSKITEAKVNTYDAHVENDTIHVTASDKTNWNGKSKVTIRRW